MADQFFPVNFDTAPVMPVEATLYTIRASLLNPETGVAIPAPDHVWLLVDVSLPAPLAISRSSPSDATGTTALGTPVPLPGSYSLLFFPAPDPAKTSAPDAELIRSIYRQKREAWIDLDKPDRWAVEPTPGSLETRRLFRVPAWSTARKAALGGFKVTPPLAAAALSRFKSQGIISGKDLAKFGPWDMPLDFNWAMAKVEFSFIDWQLSQFETLPPGLIVEALRTPKTGTPTRVAAGVTAAIASGPATPGTPQARAAYLLLEGDKTLWKECHIQFRTPGNCFIDLSGKSIPPVDNRIKLGQSSQPRDDFNPLPLDWHSFKMRASFTTAARPSGASPPAPAAPSSARSADKVWDGLRFDIAKAANGDNATISFNIDDIVLCNQAGGPITKNRKAPLTLLDHLLAIINPDPNFPYQSVPPRVDLVMPAPDALLSPSPGSPNAATTRIKSTRLIHFDGAIHAVGNDRVNVASGAIGTVPCMGARAAILGKDPNKVIANPLGGPFNVNMRLQMHLVDVPEVKDPATGAPLTHALLCVPVKVRVASNLSGGSTLKNARLKLGEAAELWSPGHPGVPPLNTAPAGGTPPATKRYALIPSPPANPSSSIIRFRSFFPEVTQTKPSIVINHTADPKGPVNGDKRPATTDGVGAAATHIDSFDSSVARDMTGQGQGGPQGDTGDGINSPGLELTHEFGHAAHNLNDEYVEILDTSKAFQIPLGHPFLPVFKQFDEGATDYRPYYSDLRSMMHDNHVPRLRHFWHHAQNLAKQFKLPQPSYDLVHETFKSTAGTNPDGSADPGTSLIYRSPQNNTRSPWPPFFFKIKIPNGFGDVALFPIGDDEGTLEHLFRVDKQPPKGLAKQDRMHAVLIVRSRICFIFDKASSNQDRFDTLQTNFQEKIYSSNYSLLIRFMLLTTLPPKTPGALASPLGLDRIAVMFQPHYSVDPKEAGQADIVFDIAKTAKPARPNPFQGKIVAPAGGGPPTVKIMATDFNFEEAWRVVLGIQNAPPGVIRQTDIDPLARLVEAQLTEPASSRQPVIFT